MLGLVESKHTEVTMQDMNKCWGNQDIDLVQVPAEEGGSGGIILTWLKDSFTLDEYKFKQHWILVAGCLQQNSFSCCICTVYAPNDRHGRLEVWNQLREVRAQRSVPWIMIEDFNEVI